MCHASNAYDAFSKSCVTPRFGVGKTCAKVILFGEHSVVYGYPAVALPLRNLCMRATVSNECTFNFELDKSFELKSKTTSLNSHSSLNSSNLHSSLNSSNSLSVETSIETNIDDNIVFSALGFTGLLRNIPPRFSSIRTAIHCALDFAGWDGERLYVLTESDFPPERGLGSSAASAGAIIRAILDYYGIEANQSQLFSLTQQAERVAHGRPSGLDAVATSSLLPVKYCNGSFDYMNINMRAWIVLADSGLKGMTRVTVEDLRKKRDENPTFVNSLLQELGDIALSAEDDLLNGSSENVGIKMIRAHRILDKLGISTPLLNDLVDAAYSNGALGAKLTGGGGGGCVIAIADSEDCAYKVSDAFKSAGAKKTWIVDISGK
ncbi:mevalonate kinase [uncultured Gardnerella sp.]|uniref:mevalonate kinase n=1 Tax=uncultured Gardnerella sp. TaxID=293424 RepID=UPI0025FF9117|nr:mevalonate kinase [uncultured Gardnerella sp.]